MKKIKVTVTIDDLDRIREQERFKAYREGREDGDREGYQRGSRAQALSILKVVEREPLTLAAYKQMLRGTTQADILPLDER